MHTNQIKNIFYKFVIAAIFILGFLLRSYAFAVYRPLWRDECSLALSIYFGSFSDLWGVLFHTQSAPPIFMTICKCFVMINPSLPEYFLRIFPFIMGLLSIYLFFVLTKNFFNSRLSIIIANLAFAINTQLIYYSHEFKQYSTDVAIVLGCIIYLSKIKLSELTTKQIIINACILAVIPLISLPALFVISGWIILQIFEKNDIKKLILYLTPIFFTMLLYYLFVLNPSRKNMLDFLGFFWEKGFLSFNIDSICSITMNNLAFYFQQCKYLFFPLLLVVIGLIILIKRKLQVDKLILLTLCLVITASFMSIYPIQERVSLYLLPIIILVVIMPFDYVKHTWVKCILGVLLCVVFWGKFNYSIVDYNSENPALMMYVLKSKYKEGDYVIYNDVSDSQFELYSHIYDFNIPDSKCGKIQLSDYGEDWYYGVLDYLPKGRKYWFYYSYDIVTKPVIPFLKKWVSKNAKILYELYPNEKSCLLYLQL